MPKPNTCLLCGKLWFCAVSVWISSCKLLAALSYLFLLFLLDGLFFLTIPLPTPADVVPISVQMVTRHLYFVHNIGDQLQDNSR